MGIAAFKILHALDARVDKLSHSYHSQGLDLLHLKRAVVPSPRTQTSLEHQSTVNADRVAQHDLTVNNTADQTSYILEDHHRLSRVLRPVFGYLTIPGYVGRSKDGLYDERYLVSWEIQADRNRPANRRRPVQNIVEWLFSLTKPYGGVLIGLRNGR